MKILDCTLRDGGYVTNWEWSDDLVRDTCLALDKCGVDIIEVGYVQNIPSIEIMPTLSNANYGFMLDFCDYDAIKHSEVSWFDDVDHINWLRIAVNPLKDKVSDLEKAVERLSPRFRILISIMRCHMLKEEYFKRIMNIKNVEHVYLADSFGVFNPLTYPRMTKNADRFGVHAHNNQSCADANSICAMYNKIGIVDGTISGIGRGAGNADICTLLNYRGINADPIRVVEQKYFAPLWQKHKWGSDELYMYSGRLGIHPNYIFKGRKLGYNDKEILAVLRRIAKSDIKNNFDESVFDGVKIAIVIPARMESSRFPGKPLAKINGKEMILHVYENMKKGFDNVIVATDSEEMYDFLGKNKVHSYLSCEEHATGTDRVKEVAKSINAEIIVNVQGDEPLIKAKHVQKVIDEMLKKPDVVHHAMAEITSSEFDQEKNIPKVVCNKKGYLMYISRSLIPGYKSIPMFNDPYAYKEVCIHAFPKKALINLPDKKGPLEQSEDCEILRCIENCIPVKMVDLTGIKNHAVDVPKDIEIVEGILNNA